MPRLAARVPSLPWNLFAQRVEVFDFALWSPAGKIVQHRVISSRSNIPVDFIWELGKIHAFKAY
jgi:hypothetical protein